MAGTLKTGPDMRYNCVMNDGTKFIGTSRKVAQNAAMATYKKESWVVAWGAPGSAKQVVGQRIIRLIGAYQGALERLSKQRDSA